MFRGVLATTWHDSRCALHGMGTKVVLGWVVILGPIVLAHHKHKLHGMGTKVVLGWEQV